VTFDSYVRELNEIMERKAQGLDEIRQKIGQILNTH
jgi:phage baseplate assembly protein W